MFGVTQVDVAKEDILEMHVSVPDVKGARYPRRWHCFSIGATPWGPSSWIPHGYAGASYLG